VLGAIALAALPAGPALCVASVGLGPTGNLAVLVNPGAGQEDDHGIILRALHGREP
jgi:hypothetical protein